MTMDVFAVSMNVKHAAIKQPKQMKFNGGQYLAGLIRSDYITYSQTHCGKYQGTTTTRWLETYPVPYATIRNTILGLIKSKAYDIMAPQTELQQTKQILPTSKITSLSMRPKSMILSG